MRQRIRDKLVGLLYGIPTGLALTAGLFHILMATGSLNSELAMGIYQVSVGILFLGAFIFHTLTGEKQDEVST